MSAPWREEDGGKRWSRDTGDFHLTVGERAGTFDAYGPSWSGLAEAYLDDGTAISWRSAPFPPTADGLLQAFAWAEDAMNRLDLMLQREESSNR